MKKLCMITLFFTAVYSVFAAGTQSRFEITKVRLNSKTFAPANGEKTTLSFEITKAADIKIGIYDRLNRLVKELDIPKADAGEHSIEWDGRNCKNEIAEGKVFLYVIEAVDSDGKKIIYNPADRTGGNVVAAADYTYDKKNKTIEYVLPKTGMVRLRAGLKDGIFIRNILDWEPQTAGRHSLSWDGKDENGLFDIGSNGDLRLNLVCYTLPANTIIISGQSKPLSGAGSKELSTTSEDIWAKKDKCPHYSHNPLNCHEQRFSISFPESNERTNEEGVPVLSGRVPIRIKIDPRDAEYMVNNKYEIMIYVDGIFLFETEDGTDPFTFHWDTQGFNKGVHIFTVNLINYDDHLGTLSKKIFLGE